MARELTYTTPTEMAEMATTAVRFHLLAGQDAVAAVMQDFAVACWGVALGAEGPSHGLVAAATAQGRLRDRCGAVPARQFLADATRTLEAAAGVARHA